MVCISLSCTYNVVYNIYDYLNDVVEKLNGKGYGRIQSI